MISSRTLPGALPSPRPTPPAPLATVLLFVAIITIPGLGLALGLDPKELGFNKHVVKPSTVIDWSTSVVAGVDGAGAGAVAASQRGL